MPMVGASFLGIPAACGQNTPQIIKKLLGGQSENKHGMSTMDPARTMKQKTEKTRNMKLQGANYRSFMAEIQTEGKKTKKQ